MDVTEQQLRDKGYSPADIAYVMRRQQAMKQQPQQQPQAPQQPNDPRARNARTPLEYILAILRGKGL